VSNLLPHMIKILSTPQIKDLDAFTIKQQNIPSIQLMERACLAFTDYFIKRFDTSQTILVVCGTGNNGGDGLGIARLLTLMSCNVKVYVIRGGASESNDFKENLSVLPSSVERVTIQGNDEIQFPESDIIIDALFGSGLSKPLEGIYAKAVEAMNAKKAIRVAVDIPSGLFSDAHSSGVIVKAHFTISFQVPKLCFFLPQYYMYVGQWSIVDIGLDKGFIEKVNVNYLLLDESSIKKLIKARNKFDHKGHHGHSLIVAGSKGKIGANILATRAALRTGSGLVTSLVPACGQVALQTAVPEAMTLIDPEEDFLTQLPDIKSFSSIGVGPGIGLEKRTNHFLSSLFSHEVIPSVIDADALNILSENREMQRLVSPNSILTPHPGEFRRLVDNWGNDFDRLVKQRALSARLKSIIVLKGAHSSISFPNGDVYFNSSGNPSMATGGSGDVLTGILTSLLAQGYIPQEAALIGVYLHGLAGDLAAKERHTIIASDIIEQIPFALKRLAS
jgi:ADP-dependent NAD(P)H-hydrate dehydratase / NAD(P)H-hydrate epimerase